MSADVKAIISKIDEEIERVRIGFLDAETPSLLNLLHDVKSTIMQLSHERNSLKKKLSKLEKTSK